MIPVFVISLPDCTGRRETISNSLNDLGIGFEFVDAVDGRHGLDADNEMRIDRQAAKKAGRHLTDAEFACALSHINVYGRIVQENIAYALVLEDDAIPYPDLVRYLKDEMFWPLDITQLHFNVARVNRWGSREVFGTYRLYFRLPKLKVASTNGYVVSNYAARLFLKYGYPVSREADWPQCIEMLIAQKRCGLIYPKLIGHPHGNEQSVINNYGRKMDKEKRRLFGIYIPPRQKLFDSYVRAPRKIFSKYLS